MIKMIIKSFQSGFAEDSVTVFAIKMSCMEKSHLITQIKIKKKTNNNKKSLFTGDVELDINININSIMPFLVPG